MPKYRVDTDHGSYIVETADSPEGVLASQTAALGGGPAPDVSARMRADALAQAPRSLTHPDEIPTPSYPVAGGLAVSPPVPFEMSARGGQQVVRGAEHMAAPGLRAKVGGAADVAEGAMQAAAPVAIPLGLMANPVGTAIGLAGGTTASKATYSGLLAAGVPEEYAHGASVVAGIVGGAKAGDAVDLADRAARAVGDKLVLPRSGTPEQRAAVDWALRQGAPLDAAAATLNPIVRGTQEIAQTTIGAGTPAQRAIAARNQWYADKGRDLAGQVSPMAATPETAGRALYDRSVQEVRGANTEANDAYAALKAREADPAAVQQVQVGTKEISSSLLDAQGKPVGTQTVPVYDNIPMPVDMRGFKQDLGPALEDIRRQVRLGQSHYAPTQIALEDIVNGPDFQRASTAEANLGALKQVSRENTLAGGVKNEAGALAASAVPKLQSAIDGAVELHGGADALNDLQTGRLKTADKYQAINLVDQYRAEPVRLFNQLTQARDGGVDFLRKVQELAPEQMPQLGRAWLDGALDQATESGGFDHAQRLFSNWQKLGDGTKQVLFKNPALISDLDHFFQSAKDSARVENPSGTARVAHITSQGALLIAAPHVGVPLLIGGNVLARLLYNPKFVRAAIRGFSTDAASAGGAAASSRLAAAAGSAAAPVGVSTNSENLPQSRGLDAAGRGQTEALPGASGTSAPASSGTAAGQAGGRGPSDTVIPVPGQAGGGYRAQYALKDLSDLQASHSGQTFQPNPKYALTNDRDYANAVNQGKIVTGASRPEFNPALHITDNPDATNGPLIVDQGGNVIGGNGRAMMLDRVYSGNPKGTAAYRALLEQKAGQFGLDPAQVRGMKQPVLTRAITDEEFARAGGKQAAITDFNKKGTAELTPGERAIADSRRVSSDTLDDIGSRLDARGPDATIAQVLEGRDGVDVLNKLIKDGVVSPQERAALADANGLTKAGKDRVSQLMVGRYFRDPAQLDTIPASIRNKVERIAAPLAQVEGRGEWTLTPHLQEALGILDRANNLGIKNVDDFLAQDGLFGKQQYSPETVRLAQVLQRMKPTELTAAARQYAQDATFAAKGETTMFGPAPSFRKSFEDAFGKSPANTLSKNQ